MGNLGGGQEVGGLVGTFKLEGTHRECEFQSKNEIKKI